MFGWRIQIRIDVEILLTVSMELEEPINANDEKDVCDNNDVEVIRRVLDEMIESRLKVVCQHDLVCISNSECWKETGIKLLSNSTFRIFDGEISEFVEGPPKKRRKDASDAKLVDVLFLHSLSVSLFN
ncbi:unnamed protein product [Brugia timori]|uniref:RNA-directed DNA polymerase, eukaryota, reverse transcriptase zinc-binding domain protein n=1 Tax=Brugia timori TaxID=42155 RepID=A0A0R3Q6L9_9BILA|nr:unnamed protein product [Brugia timori]